MREPAALYCPEACEFDMVHAALEDDMDSMKTLYQAAQPICYRVEEFPRSAKKPGSNSTMVTITLEDVPVELYTMLRWIRAGPADKLVTEGRTITVDRAALTLCQNLRF